MSVRPYPTTKPAQTPWLDKIPSHWNEKPMLAVASKKQVNNTGMKEDNLLSLSYGKIKRKDINTSDGLLPASYETYQIVEPDDIVFRLTDLQNDKRSLRSAICRERGIITSAYVAVKPEDIDSAFLNYLMRAYDVQKVFYSMGGGLRQSLGFADLRRLPVVAPEIDEQRIIARYLDRETARIDGLIEKKVRFIVLLKEKHVAVIAHAVTKGLIPDAPMKDSGVEWLGTVPSHWNEKPMLAVASKKQVNNTGMKEDNLLSLSYGKIKRKDINTSDGLLPASYETYQIVEPDDIVFRLTDLQNDKRSLRSAICRERGIITSAYVAVKPEDIDSAFLNYLMRAYDVQKVFYSMGGGLRQSLGFADLRRLPVVAPEIDEQRTIARYLDCETARIDTLIIQTNRSIVLLKEKRAALITAAVTGKIDVRSAS
jgi:type I restriction enzyme S subunit